MSQKNRSCISVIFITENDSFGQGEAIYRIERSNLETKELFGDEAHIYYVNARYNGDDELGDLMHDFLCSDPEEMRRERLKERADYLKHNPKGVAAMCQLLEEMCEEARAEGVEQGIEQGIEQGLKAEQERIEIALQKYGLDDKEIAKIMAMEPDNSLAH